MTSRIATVGLVCASLYAAVLGAGAHAQDDASTPAPAVATQTAAPQASQQPTTATPSPFASPVETVVEATPAASQTATATADPTVAPTTDPTVDPTAHRPSRRLKRPLAPTATATPAPAVDKSAEKKRRKPNRLQGSSETKCPGGGKLVGTVIDPSSSTSARECNEKERPVDERSRLRPSARRHPHTGGHGLLAGYRRPGADRRAQLLHRQVPHPAVPAPDLPGRRHPVRHPLGDPRRDQRDRDRLRAQPQRLLRRRAGLDAVHARNLGRCTASTPTATARRTRSTRSTAIFAAARYLRAAGADKDLYRAIFAYNHADWYVESVLMRARVIGGLPADLVGSLTGLTQGRFPVAGQGDVRGCADQGAARAAVRAGQEHRQRRRVRRHAARDPHLQPHGRARVAVQDGRITPHRPLAQARQLRRAAGQLRQHLRLLRARRAGRDLSVPQAAQGEAPRARAARRRPAPSSAASATSDLARHLRRVAHGRQREASRARQGRLRASGAALPGPRPAKERLFANPGRPQARAAGGDEQLAVGRDRHDGRSTAAAWTRASSCAKPLKKGARISGGTILGRHRRGPARSGTARALRDPPGRPRRAADRPQADPRRLEAARVDRDLPLGEAQPVLRRGRREALDRPDPADEQAGAAAPRAAQPADRHLRVRPPRRRHRPGRPARARDARVPRRLGAEADRDVDALRPRLLHGARQRLRALERQRRRHRRDQRHHDHAPPPRARARSPT